MLRILWIEDEMGTMTGFARELQVSHEKRSIGCNLVTAGTRGEAWEKVCWGTPSDQDADSDKLHWDIIFLDLMLPNDERQREADVQNRSAGLQILLRYRTEIEPDLPRPAIWVVVTALIDREIVRKTQGQLTERDLYIEKTVTIEEFLQAVEPVISAAVAARGDAEA